MRVRVALLTGFATLVLTALVCGASAQTTKLPPDTLEELPPYIFAKLFREMYGRQFVPVAAPLAAQPRLPVFSEWDVTPGESDSVYGTQWTMTKSMRVYDTW